MDASASPTGILSGQHDDQASHLGVDGWPAPRFVRWLYPMTTDSLFVPSEHGSVDVSELWSIGLALQDQDLVTASEDLCVPGIACGENQSESVENKANQPENRVTSAEG